MSASRSTTTLVMALGLWSLTSTASAIEPMEFPTIAEATAAPEPATEAPESEQVSPHGPKGRRNSIVLGTQAKIPDWGSSLTYQRALTERISLGAGVEYGYQVRGYWHLQGVGESLSGQLWLGEAFHGVFIEGSMALTHQFLARLPRLSTTALVPGLSLGARWTHRSGLTVGGSAGLRWGRVIRDSNLVCSRPKYCNSVREGAYVRFTADIGYVF